MKVVIKSKMNNNFSSEQVYDAISVTANTFFNNLTGSKVWKFQENEIISGYYNSSGLQVNFRLREFMKPDGSLVLPQTPINPDYLTAGSYFGQVEVKIPNENKFSVHTPHNKTENQVHLQKGKEKITLNPSTETITDHGILGSGLFLKFDSKEEAIKKIQEIREK